jgi:demethylmenaquinone methyltransferase/2-methoxy-6-polyprenyl-1,4-benzoquinol methylase
MNEKRRDSLISSEENRAMFDFIAGWYDSTNKILSLGLDGYWRRRAVALLRPEPELIYLDVGCGTGDISLEILRHCPGSRVVGIDPSERMLAVGRDKVKAARLDDSITLLKGDALDLQFRGDSFDGAITAFCIRNVTHRLQALREFRRVLRPGGRLVILELTDPEGPIMRPLFRIYSNVVMPFVTKIMSSRPAYRYLSNSMADFPKAEQFLKTMEQAGFVDTSYFRMTGGITTVFVGAAPRE